MSPPVLHKRQIIPELLGFAIPKLTLSQLLDQRSSGFVGLPRRSQPDGGLPAQRYL